MKTPTLFCGKIFLFLVLLFANLKSTSAKVNTTSKLYKEFLKFQKAVQSSNYTCSSFEDCSESIGYASTCNALGRCVCDLGYEIGPKYSNTPFPVTCQKITCTSDFDCMSAFGIMSHCDLSTKTCVCDTGYYYDTEVEVCSRTSATTTTTTIDDHYYYPYDGGQTNYGLVVGLPVTLGGLCIILVAIFLVRRKRQKELVARMAPARQNPHVQVHPQPVYYYQNPANNVTPGVAQNQAVFNSTFTGYQPQFQPPPYYLKQQPPAPEVHSSAVRYPTFPQNH